MGFFSSFMKWAGEKIEDLGDAIGGATGWYGISTVGEKIQEVFSDEISEEKPYDKNTSNANDAERLNELLVSFSEASLKQSETIEKQCIRKIEEYCDALIEFLEKSSDITKDRSNLKRVKKNRGKIKKVISGAIKEPLAKKMSLDDPECLRILKLDSGIDKRNRMKNFSNKIIQEALNNLSEKVRDVLDEQSEGIEEFFSSYAESQEKEMMNIKQQYDAMLQDGNVEASDIEKRCIDPLVIIRTAELMEGLL